MLIKREKLGRDLNLNTLKKHRITICLILHVDELSFDIQLHYGTRGVFARGDN